MNENTTPTKLECLVDTSLLNNPQRFRERAAAIEANEAGQPVDKWDEADQKWIELVEISAFFYDRRYRARPACIDHAAGNDSPTGEPIDSPFSPYPNSFA